MKYEEIDLWDEMYEPAMNALYAHFEQCPLASADCAGEYVEVVLRAVEPIVRERIAALMEPRWVYVSEVLRPVNGKHVFFCTVETPGFIRVGRFYHSYFQEPTGNTYPLESVLCYQSRFVPTPPQERGSDENS